MVCKKCGKKMKRVWDGTKLCPDWKCWPATPTNPQEIVDGAPPLASELSAFGTGLIALINKHQPFIATSVAIDDGSSPLSPVAAMVNVVADVYWQLFDSHVNPNVERNSVMHAYASLWADAITNVSGGGGPPPGVTLN